MLFFARMTSLFARTFRFAGHGEALPGSCAAFADFDPVTNANPHHHVSGFRSVFVNGTLVAE